MSIWTKIKDFSNKVGKWINGATEVTDAKISKYAPIAVDVLQSIKKFNDSSSADAVESIVESVSGIHKPCIS